MGQGFWENGCTALKLAPTLGSVKCSIFHGDWRFHFFPNFVFTKFRVHLNFICTFGIFVS
jgi:hypothetical protein